MAVLGQTLTALVIALVCLPRGDATVCVTPPCNNNNTQASVDDSQNLSHADSALSDCPPCQTDGLLKTSQSQRGREISQPQKVSSDGRDFNPDNSSLNQLNSSLNGTNTLTHSHWQVPSQGLDMDQVNQSPTGMNQSHPCCTHHSDRHDQSREAAYKHALVCLFFIGLAVMLLVVFAKLGNPIVHISSMAKKMMSWARGSFRQNDQPTYEPVLSEAHP